MPRAMNLHAGMREIHYQAALFRVSLRGGHAVMLGIAALSPTYLAGELSYPDPVFRLANGREPYTTYGPALFGGQSLFLINSIRSAFFFWRDSIFSESDTHSENIFVFVKFGRLPMSRDEKQPLLSMARAP